MFTAAIFIIKAMTLASFLLVGLFVGLELFTRATAAKWEEVVEPKLQLVKQNARSRSK